MSSPKKKPRCRRVMERWHLDANRDVNLHQMQACTLREGHAGPCVYGPWENLVYRNAQSFTLKL